MFDALHAHCVLLFLAFFELLESGPTVEPNHKMEISIQIESSDCDNDDRRGDKMEILIQIKSFECDNDDRRGEACRGMCSKVCQK